MVRIGVGQRHTKTGSVREPSRRHRMSGCIARPRVAECSLGQAGLLAPGSPSHPAFPPVRAVATLGSTPRSQLRDSPGLAPGSLRCAGHCRPRSGRLPRASLSSRAVARVDSIVLVNTGYGKGKSSAAFGVMARGWARGWTVGVVQFVKGGKWKTGERKLADHLGIEWHTLGDGFTWESTDLDETAAKGRHAWEVAAAKLASGEYDLLILDEITYAVKYGWVPAADVAAGIRNRAPRTNVVMTGRGAAPELLEVADTATEMVKLKHAYDLGVTAKKGIEY